MGTIQFRVAAKTDVGLVRKNNEDNFQVAADLSSGQMRWVNNEVCTLGDKGALLVVADGMGGMNAGEVASELAIKAVREYFSPENITPEVMKNRFSIEKYMNDVIVAADAKIKREAKDNPETRGMGTTIVIGWVLNGKLYVSWCGDSRAYVYNPKVGLHQITKDHSYVQTLVDKGVISQEDAFDYPDSNIITRSLSDGAPKAKPESLLQPYDLSDGDIVLLCTDGLSGMIRDNEIEDVIRRNENDMDVLSDELIRAACEAEGSDNITLCLCQILQGCGACNASAPQVADNRANNNGGNMRTVMDGGGNAAKRNDEGERWKRNFFMLAVVLIVVLAAGAAGWYFMRDNKDSATPAVTDTTKVADDQTKGTETVPPSASTPAPDKSAVGGESDAVDGLNELNKKAEERKKQLEEKKRKEAEDAKRHKDKMDDAIDELTPQGRIDTGNDDGKNAGNVQLFDYTVRKDETFFGIAKRFKTTEAELKKYNPRVKTLKEGMVIKVPRKK